MFIHSRGDGHLGYFQFLALVSNVAVDICIKVFVKKKSFIFLVQIPRSGIVGSCDNGVLTARLFPKVVLVSPHPCQHFRF